MSPSTRKTACSDRRRGPGFFALAAFVFLVLRPSFGAALELGSFFPLSEFLPAAELRNEASPRWKLLWDEARALARKGRLDAAEKRYAAAAAAAGGLRQLQWERACVLAGLARWQDAARVLEPLVEQDPAQVDYLTMLGLVMFEQGSFSRALDLFRRAAGLSASDLHALAGRGLCLIALNRKDEALPLLQRLFRLQPRRDLRLALASLAFELKRFSLARRYVAPLARERKAAAAVLRLAARVHERLRRNRAAAVYWRRVLAIAPGDREAHGRLALYYEKTGRYGKALFHLKKLLADDPKNASLLRNICRILVQQDRFTEAVAYFDRYVEVRPDDREGLRAIVNLDAAAAPGAVDLYRRILSVRPDDDREVAALTADLVAAGDVEGAIFVHEHLVRIAKGDEKARAIRRMLPVLERFGRRERLIRALEELVRLAPDDTSAALRLASIYLDTGDTDKAGALIGGMAGTGVAASADFLCLRGRLEQARGQGYAAMRDFIACIGKRPWEDGVRRRAVEIAARLGLTRTLSRLAGGLPGGDSPFLARLLGEAGRYHEAVAVYDELLDDAGDDTRAGLLVGQAAVLFKAGLDPEAEARLFQALGRGDAGRRAAAMLFSHYLARGETDLAAAVLEYRSRLTPDGSPSLALDRARLLAARGELDQARETCLDLMAVAPPGADLAGIRMEADLLAADILVRQDRLREAERICLTILGRDDDRRVVAMLCRIYRLAGEDAAAERLLAAHIGKNGDPAALAAMARALFDNGLADRAADLAARVLAVIPDSVTMTMLRARSLASAGDPEAALAVLKGSPVFAGEESLQAMAASMYAAMDDYRAAAAQATMVLLSWPERRDMQMLNIVGRAARDGHGAAAAALAEVFDPDLDRKVSRALDRAGIRIEVPEPRRSIWEIITFSRGRERSRVERAMDPAVIIASMLAGGRLAAVVAPWYADYHWRGRVLDAIADFR